MLITRIEWMGVRVPFRSPLLTSQMVAAERHGLLVLLHGDAGAIGVGEASPVGAGSESEVRDLVTRLQDMAPSLLGLSPDDALTMLDGLPVRGEILEPRTQVAALMFGLETAAYDLLGKQSGVPVTTLLGGEPRMVTVNALIGAESPAEAMYQAVEAVAEGFGSVKLKLGAATPGQDEAMVRQVRHAVGPDVRVRADANEAWSVKTAIDVLSRLEPYGLEYLEQPVVAADVAGMAQVRRAVGVPIAADEALSGLDDARRLLETGAADVFIVKPARVGGLRRAKELMALAEVHGVISVVTSSLETGAGVAAGLHLAATGPATGLASGLATAPLLSHDLLTEPLTPVRGSLAVSPAPGLGIKLDMEAVRRYGMGVEGRAGG
jgi:o-succinylbenzoate synthase